MQENNSWKEENNLIASIILPMLIYSLFDWMNGVLCHCWIANIYFPDIFVPTEEQHGVVKEVDEGAECEEQREQERKHHNSIQESQNL